jgi:nicotinate phosphoribosyltransferase
LDTGKRQCLFKNTQEGLEYFMNKKIEAGRAEVLDKIVKVSMAGSSLPTITDKYFSHTSRIVSSNGDSQVTYAIFMRQRVIAALEPAIRLIHTLVPEAKIERFFEEGDKVPAEAKMLEVTGPMSKLSEVETLMLQKIGFPCICARNAHDMCRAVVKAKFMDMHARHGSGMEMNMLASYGAAVGSDSARANNKDVKGFVGSSQDLTAPLFGADNGIGTMPHSLVGYTGGDVLEATKLFVREIPDANTIISLVDYNGHETSDAIRCADWFYGEAKLDDQGKTFGVRLDTHGGRFSEGLTFEKSVDIVGEFLGVEGEYNIVERILGPGAVNLDSGNQLVDRVRRIMFGAGVSAASIINMRATLDKAGYKKALIVASSGFNPQKCHVMGAVNVPVDMIGTGSFLPSTLAETYATADIISYDGQKRVKLGREFLID